MKKLVFFGLFALLPMMNLYGETTLSIIKPDAVGDNHIGEIVGRFERAGLKVAAIKMVSLSKPEAMRFYVVHKDKPFYQALVDFMSSGPVVALALEGDNAVVKVREIMGTTDPQKATPGTIRRDFAKSIQNNAVHGSDSPASAKEELAFFFSPQEIKKRS